MNRLLLYAMFIVMLGMLGTAWLDHHDFEGSMLGVIRQQELRNASGMRKSLDERLDRANRNSQVLALTPTFQNALDPATTGHERELARRELSAMFQDLPGVSGGELSLVLASRTGEVVVSVDDSLYRELTPEYLEYVVNEALLGRSTGAFGVIPREGVSAHYVIAEPVRINEYIAGILVIQLKLGPIIESWTELLPDITGSFAALVDQNGLILGCTTDAPVADLYNFKSDLLAAARGDLTGTFDLHLAGSSWLSAYSTSRHGGWKVIVASPVEEVLAPASHAMTRSFTVHGLGAIVSIGIVIGLITMLTRDVRRRLAVVMSETGESLPKHSGFFEEIDLLLGYMHKAVAAMRENAAITERSRLELAEHKERLEDEVRKRTEELGRERVILQEAEEKLIQARDEAEKSSRAKKDFMDRMSHEFRTPMNAIMGMSYLCLHTELTPKQHEYLSKIQTAAGNLLALINDVLDFSRLESGHINIERTTFKIYEIVNNTYDLLELKASGKGLAFNIHLANDLPNLVIGDPLRLSQVLTHLASNAIKFTSSGHVDICVTNEEGGEGQNILHFTVSDTGIGMRPEQLPGIFGAFNQADGYLTRKYEGSGLGLTISKNLVELMGGKIWVESELGRGSSFHCVIPFASVSGPDTLSSPAAPASNYITVKLNKIKGARILLVEDNETNQIIAQEILERLGMIVKIACNGQEALNALAVEKFAFVLMDIQMPVMDGLTAARKIRAASFPGAGDLPIVAMTAHVQVYDREQSLLAGMNDHLTKPVNPEALASVLAAWIKPGKNFLDPAAVSSSVAVPIEQFKQKNGEVMYVPGIDTKSGLARVMGNEKLYKNLLQRLATKYNDTPEKIREALDKPDMETAVRLAHTLKGVAAGLGADSLALASSELEQGLKNNGAIQTLLGNFSEELDKIVHAIIDSIGTGDVKPATPVSGTALSPGELVEIKSFMEKLPELAETDFITAQNGLNNLAGKLESSVAGAEYRALREALEDFELEAINARANALMKKLQG